MTLYYISEGIYTMKVLRDFILVEEPKVEEKKSEGGLILTQDRPSFTDAVERQVVQVGKDVKEISVGDTVLFISRSGTVVKRPEGDWRILREEDILAVL